MMKENVKLEVYEAIKNYASDQGIKEMAIREDMKLADFGFDSLDIIDISLAIDERLGIDTDYDEFRKCETIGNIIDLEKKLIDEKDEAVK